MVIMQLRSPTDSIKPGKRLMMQLECKQLK